MTPEQAVAELREFIKQTYGSPFDGSDVLMLQKWAAATEIVDKFEALTQRAEQQ